MRPASVGFHCPDDVELGARTTRAPRTVVGARLQATAYVTWALIGLNVLVYLATVVGTRGGLNDPSSSKLFSQWVLVPFSVAHNHQFIRLITAAFLHLNLTHLLLNMVALGFVGPFLERALGWWRFLAVYLISALGGSALVYAGPGHFTAVAGASGAIYGLFAASLVLARRVNLDLRAFATVVAINFLLTFSLAGISIEGHIGGFVTGGLAALAIVGLPQRATRVSVRMQFTGMAVLVTVLLVTIAVRTATFPTPTPG